MVKQEFLTIDGIPVAIEGEKNILELIRKVGIKLPTFCYHSELSIYGACRMCMVETPCPSCPTPLSRRLWPLPSWTPALSPSPAPTSTSPRMR